MKLKIFTMNGRNRKKRFSTVGRRTGYDVRAGKRIRESKDGMERFDDYWTSSGDDTDASNPSPLCSSPVLSNAPRMSSFIKNINPSPRRELPARISCARTPTLKKDSNEDEVHLSVVPKQIIEKKQLLAKGRRTGADILAGKEIQIINGIENFDNYWTDSSALTTMRASKASNNRSSVPNYTPRGKISNTSRKSVRNKPASPCVPSKSPLSSASTHEENEINQDKNNTIIITLNNRSSVPNYTSRGKISNISRESVRDTTASPCASSASHLSSTSTHEENEINQDKNNTIIITPNNRSSVPNYTSRCKISNTSRESVRDTTASPCASSTSPLSGTSTHEENEINQDKNNTIIITPNNRSSVPNYTSRCKISNTSRESVRDTTASPCASSTSPLSGTSTHEENEINQDKNNTIIITPNNRSSVPNYNSRGKISNISRESVWNKTASPSASSTSHLSGTSTHEENEINQDKNNTMIITPNNKSSVPNYTSRGKTSNIIHESVRNKTASPCVSSTSHLSCASTREENEINQDKNNTIIITSNNRSSVPNYTSRGKISNISHESVHNETAPPCVLSTSHLSSTSTQEENEINQDKNNTIITSNNGSLLPNYTPRGKISNISHKSVRNKTASPCVPSKSHLSSPSTHEENEINQDKNNTIIITPNNRSSVPNCTSRRKISNISHKSVQNKTASPCVPSASQLSSTSTHEENEFNQDNNNEIDVSERCKKRKKNSEQQQKVEVESSVTQLRRSKRKRFPPLERWRSQRLRITYENFNIVSVDVDEGNEPIIDDVKRIRRNCEKYEERRKKMKSRKPKISENSLNLKQVRSELTKIEVFDPTTSDEKFVYLHRPHNTLLWSVPPLKEKKTASYTIAKCFSSDLISFGFIEIRCGKEKSKQHSPEHNIAFNVIKGNNLKMTIHQSNFTLKELDFIAVPAGNIYSIFNKGKSDAVLSFSTFKTPMFDYQFPNAMEDHD